MALSKTTQDHDEIRRWAEERGGVPADVESTERDGETGIIRIEFPKATNANDSKLKQISWEDFFEKFDASGLSLVYQEQTADGEESNFNKLVHAETTETKSDGAASRSSGRKGASKTAARKGAAKKAGSAKKAAPAKKTTAGSKTSAKKAAAKEATKKAGSAKTPVKKTGAKKVASKAASGAKGAVKKAVPAKRVAGKKTAGRRAK